MSIQGDAARDDMAKGLLKVIAEQLKEHPEAVVPLKAVAREAMENLPYRPAWAGEYAELFRD